MRRLRLVTLSPCHLVTLSSFLLSLTRFAGTPQYSPYGSVLRLTTALAPMMQPLAIVTLAVTVTFAPSQTSSTSVIGPATAAASHIALPSRMIGSWPMVAKTQCPAMLHLGPIFRPPH